MNIINPSALMKSSPSNGSALETECLFGEKIEILKENYDWVYCKLATDNYLGWIKKNNIGKSENPTHRVIITELYL